MNLRDFQGDVVAPLRVAAVSPDDLLLSLFADRPDSVGAILSQQAASLQRPPFTVGDILRGLALHAPRFAAAVAQVMSL